MPREDDGRVPPFMRSLGPARDDAGSPTTRYAAMKYSLTMKVLAGIALLALAGCVAAPPRTRYYDDDYYQRRAVYDCSTCGVIREVDRVYVDDNGTSGGGAVIGAIIGGVLGSTIGKGDGRTAATVGGAVAGGFAGNAIERNQNRGYGGREAWQFTVRLDNGRWARVTQWDAYDLRPGDRVMIRDNRLMRLR
ncbi:MAG TPA: glycine zipper 2TM domain-containing protein [Dokdonella sp.]